MSAAHAPRFSLLTMYAPPPEGYARTVCRYEITTIAINAAIAPAIGITSPLKTVLTIASWMKISPVAYATEESASDANTGRARVFGSRVCSRWALENAGPTRMLLRTVPVGFGAVRALIGPPSGVLGNLDRRGAEVEGHARDDNRRLEQQEARDVEGGLVVQDVLPPVGRDELGEHDRHDRVPAARLLADLVQQRDAEVAERRLHHHERHVHAALVPGLDHALRLLGIAHEAAPPGVGRTQRLGAPGRPDRGGVHAGARYQDDVPNDVGRMLCMRTRRTLELLGHPRDVREDDPRLEHRAALH